MRCVMVLMLYQLGFLVMARKTVIVDELLNSIANELDAGRLPSVKDSIDLECLYLEYREYDGKRLASELGLRDGNTLRNIEGFEGEKLTQDFINALVGQQLPKQSHSVIRAYVDKETTAKGLFGERDRKNRNDIPWQLRRFRGELVYLCMNNIDGLSDAKFNVLEEDYERNNVFDLLQDVTENLTLDKIVRRHPAVNIEQLEQIKKLIADEKKSLEGNDERLNVIKALDNRVTRHVFVNDYVDYKEALEINLNC